MTERTKRTLKAAELKATETFLKAREYLDNNQVKAITCTQNYGVTTRRELGLLTRAQITDEILTGESKKIPRLQGSKIWGKKASLSDFKLLVEHIGHNLYFVSKVPYPVLMFRQIVAISRW